MGAEIDKAIGVLPGEKEVSEGGWAENKSTALISLPDFNVVKGTAKAILAVRPVTQEDKVAYAARGIKLLKELKAFIACARDDNRKDAQKMAKEVLLHLSSFGLIPNDERSKTLVRILNHYSVDLLGDDKILADWFDKARQEYRNNPQDVSSSVNFGWILHDCLKTSMRLRNTKLIRYFLDEYERWEYKGAPNESNESVERLKKCRAWDMKRAKAFLTGPIDAIQYKDTGEWENALRAAEAFLKRNPRNELAYSIALDACDEQKNYSKMLLLCIEAIKSVPDNGDFQSRFVHVIWSIYKATKNNNAAVAGQNTAGLCALLQTMDEVFPLLGEIAPKTKEYSSLLAAATKIVMFVCGAPLPNMTVVRLKSFKKAMADAKSLKERAIYSYISFVKKWGLGNLTDEDKADRFVNERRHASLTAKVVLALLKCVATGDARAIVSAEPWIMEFVSDKSKLFAFGLSYYLWGLANAWFKLGDMEKSRMYAIKLVRDDQSAGWRWRVLARTYPKDSQEKIDCMSHAGTFEQCKASARFGKIVDEVCKEAKFSDDEIELAANEGVRIKSIRDSRAEALLIEDTSRYDGIVLTRLCDKRQRNTLDGLLDDRTSLRVWWRDGDGSEKTDFVSFSNFKNVDVSVAGAPVRIFVAVDLDKAKVVKVLPRPGAKPFDLYPYRVGIIVARNESRHSISVMYDEGLCCSVNVKRAGCNTSFAVGDFCRIALWERAGMAPLFLDIEESDDNVAMPVFVKYFEGNIIRKPGCREAHVGEIVVPSGAYSLAMIGKKVRGLAAAFLAENGARVWRAVTVSTTSKNLEVRP